ncbi:MAG TPA: alpha/beta fold hydrolase [Methylomirabilota bacterium]|nr:alpha/beta fold hydrolase [Methylomirabilota bacterium]
MNTYVLDLRERDVGGPVTSGHLYMATDGGQVDADGPALPAFTALTRGREVVALVHGYNTSRPVGWDALVRFARFLDAGGVTAVLMAVLWPGDGWAKALTYPFEGRDADDAAESLEAWIRSHVDASARISLVAHSLGCRVAMRAAQRLAEMTGPGAPRLARVCLMAAAVDNDCLGQEGATCYRDGTLAAERLAVLASHQDRVLELAYPLGDLAQTFLSPGEHWGSALGRTGPVERDPDVTARIEPIPLSSPDRKIDHGDYLGVKSAGDAHTIAQADQFVAGFLIAAPPHRWLAAGP